jgi:hypothetical protein
MAIPASDSGGGNFEPLKPDSYVARCYQMVHIGTVPETYEGKHKMQNKVMITFEIPSEMRTYREEEGERPASISKEYTVSLGENATLRKDLESWRGKPFTPDELKAFDLEKLVGAPCMLNIIEKLTQNGPKPRIATINKLHKDLKCPDQINPSRVLSYDKFDLTLFESLPEFLKDKVKSSLEYKAMVGETKAVASNIPAEMQVPDDDEDSLPF